MVVEDAQKLYSSWSGWRSDACFLPCLHARPLTRICLFSSRSLWASIWSLLHSSMIFFTSPSSRVELSDLGGSEEDSDFSKLDDIILLDSMSCWLHRVQLKTSGKSTTADTQLNCIYRAVSNSHCWKKSKVLTVFSFSTGISKTHLSLESISSSGFASFH